MEESEDYPSKTAKKKEMHALQALAIELANLPQSMFEELSLPTELVIAIKDYQRMKSHGAKHRQAQFLGKVMRKVDHQKIQENYQTLQKQQQMNLNRAEYYRKHLLSEEPEMLTGFIREYPNIDRQQLRQLIKDAKKECQQQQFGKAYKGLFKFLTQVIQDSE